MSINYGRFTDEEEQAAIEAIVAERDDLREKLRARDKALDEVVKSADAMRDASDVLVGVLLERLAAAEEELAHLRARSDRPPGGGPPPEIYLQWYGDDDGYHLIDDEAAVACVTWCDTRVWPRDVRYVRADDTAAPDEEE